MSRERVRALAKVATTVPLSAAGAFIGLTAVHPFLPAGSISPAGAAAMAASIAVSYFVFQAIPRK